MVGAVSFRFFHSNEPQKLFTLNKKVVDILQICRNAVPQCNLHPLLFNGHLQMLWSAFKPKGPQLYYRRKRFESTNKPYEGSFTVDFATKAFSASDPTLYRRTIQFSDEELSQFSSLDSKPMVIVLHGLAGGSHEVYLRHAIWPLFECGLWEACVLNARGCARSELTSKYLHHGKATWDLRQTILWIQSKFPNRPLFGLGFSLGANVLTNYCGEEGDGCVLKAAVVCSNPFDLELGVKQMKNTFIGRELYLRVITNMVKKQFERHQNKIDKFIKLDKEKIKRAKYLFDFDREVQCRIWNYDSAFTYYRDTSSTEAVSRIRIPFFAINSLDDPIALKEGIPFERFQENPYTILVTTSRGGHICWFEPTLTRWYPKPVSTEQ